MGYTVCFEGDMETPGLARSEPKEQGDSQTKTWLPRSKGGFHFEKYPILVLNVFSAFRSFVLRRPLTGGSDALPRVSGEEQKAVLFSQQALKCPMHLIHNQVANKSGVPRIPPLLALELGSATCFWVARSSHLAVDCAKADECS